MRREERGRTRWLTNEEEYQLISTLRAFDYADVADLCIVAIDTGCRLGELLGVQHQLDGDRLHLQSDCREKTSRLVEAEVAVLEGRERRDDEGRGRVGHRSTDTIYSAR